MELELYKFMDQEIFDKLETAEEFVNYFILIKQDLLNKLDKVEYDLINAKSKYKLKEADTLLNFNFKEEYKKDNEQIRNAHILNENFELHKKINTLKHDKIVLQHQIDAVNDAIKINMKIIGNGCDCGGK